MSATPTIKKGIILAGGSGTRLRPLTDAVCKQLLPVYDKPMIHYPLATLMLLGIRDILIISTPKDTPVLQQVLGDGRSLGLTLHYRVQPEPKGLPEAFLIGADFIAGAPVCLILGDNILHWGGLREIWHECLSVQRGAYLIGVRSHEPERFGVIEMDDAGQIVAIEEKPVLPKSNLVATGLYFYDGHAVDYTRTLKPSVRGELEITDLNKIYLEQGTLKVKLMSRGVTWMDTGTFDSLMGAANFMSIIEQHQGVKIACIEEVAYNKGFIDYDQLQALAARYGNNPYGDYLRAIDRANLDRKSQVGSEPRANQ